MDNPSDEAIAEALRLQGDVGIVTVEDVREYAKLGAGWAKDTLAHARTIDQRNKLVEALERIRNPSVVYDGAACKQIADAALTQIRSGQ